MARAIVIERSSVDTVRWKWANISAYKEFILRPDWLAFDAASPSREELMRGSWLVRDYTGNGEPQPLTDGSFTTGWLSVDAAEAVDLLTGAMQRPSRNGGAPGQSRLALLPKLIGVGGVVTNSTRFGDKKKDEYVGAVFVLKHLLTHGYTAAEREAAGVGAQTTPHTLAAAIVQLEARRKLAAAAAPASTSAAATAVVPATRTAAACGNAAATGSAAAPAAGAAAAAAANLPVPLGRHNAGLSDAALARVRAAVAAAREGSSYEEVARAAMLSVLGEEPPTHVDAPPLVCAPQAPLEYGADW